MSSEVSLRCLVIPSNAVFHGSTPLELLHLAVPLAELAPLINDLVGGHFQSVRLPLDSWCYLNENGKVLGLAENLVATMLAHAAGLSMADWVVGQVVVFGGPDAIGNETSVSDKFVTFVERQGCTVRRGCPPPSMSNS